MHCKSLWIKASAKCINVNVNNNNQLLWCLLIQEQKKKKKKEINNFYSFKGFIYI